MAWGGLQGSKGRKRDDTTVCVFHPRMSSHVFGAGLRRIRKRSTPMPLAFFSTLGCTI